jgi:cyanophycinase-like exopeptidase
MSRLVLMGSGETSPSMIPVHRDGMKAVGATRVMLLETPFGFQENADQLVDKIVGFFDRSLSTPVEVSGLRSRRVDEVAVAKVVASVRSARYVFSGPGSPTYALDIWAGIGMGEALASVIRGGGAVVLASAAALTAGSHTIPVYEIYKVGQEPFLRPGLDVTGALGIPVMVVPHWNNAEGGNHDTSRCFIGRRRLEAVAEGRGLLGIDEHTAAVLDFARGTLEVAGLGTVTLQGQGERVLEKGTTIGFEQLSEVIGGPIAPGCLSAPLDREVSSALDAGQVDDLLQALLALEASAAVDPARRQELRSGLVHLAIAAERGSVDPKELVGDYVALLLELRASARAHRRFDDADMIRQGLEALGVEVRDTSAGVEWDLL